MIIEISIIICIDISELVVVVPVFVHHIFWVSLCVSGLARPRCDAALVAGGCGGCLGPLRRRGACGCGGGAWWQQQLHVLEQTKEFMVVCGWRIAVDSGVWWIHGGGVVPSLAKQWNSLEVAGG